MNKNTAALLILAEENFGLLTKALKAKSAVSRFEGKVTSAIDAFSGKQPEAIIPEGFMLIPLELNEEQATSFATKLGTDTYTANATYTQFLELLSE